MGRYFRNIGGDAGVAFCDAPRKGETMTIKIQRGRQFLVGEAGAALFTPSGRSGGFLEKASAKLVERQHIVQLRAPNGRTLTLKTQADWNDFLGKHAANKEQVKDFPRKFGITFSDFVNVLDDVAAGDEQGLTLDLRPSSELAKALSLDKVDGDYALKLAKGATVKLSGTGGVTTAIAVGTPAIGPDILATPIGTDWERDRTEQEAWADFKVKDGANAIFRRTNASSVFEKLTDPKWDDPEAMALVERFTMPMHLELTTRPDGTRAPQDRDEMFRETYFDDPSGALSKAGASVRARVRFDDNEPYTVRRVLIQAKEGRAVDGDSSAVHKFEKRFEGGYAADEAKAQELLRTGKDTDGTSPLKVAQMLYKLAKDRGTLPPDQNLRLEPKSIILQKRRRSHLQFESLSDVQGKRARLQQEIDAFKSRNEAVPPALQRYADKLDAQVKFLTEASELLRKYGQYMPSNTDGFILSADRYSVYDPSMRASPPNDIDDEVGRVGRGLHIEAEWDTASSDPFERCGKEIEKRLAASPANADELKADLAKLDGIRKAILKDVAEAVLLMKEKMIAAGLEPDDRRLSKEERASEFMNDARRAVNWL